MATVSVETENLAKLIKNRRTELGLTVEDAAYRAGVGVKSWYRYESGHPIRLDKCKGVCKALNWAKLPGQEDVDISEYTKLEAWSPYIAANFGVVAAIFFATGSDILLDYIQDDLESLVERPKGTHVGELPCSWLADSMPEQFLMNYDYEFVYKMKSEMILLRRCASSGNSIVAHSVVQELLLHLSNDIGKSSFETDENVKRIIENEEEFFDDILDDVDFEDEDYFNEEPIYNEEWVFDLFGDKDIVTYLYSNFALEADNCYHFDHWFEHQFYAD